MKHKQKLLPIGILTLFVATAVSASFGASSQATPLMRSLHRFHGDKATWSFESGVLSGEHGGCEASHGREKSVHPSYTKRNSRCEPST
jgi:hypothetical protein